MSASDLEDTMTMDAMANDEDEAFNINDDISNNVMYTNTFFFEEEG